MADEQEPKAKSKATKAKTKKTTTTKKKTATRSRATTTASRKKPAAGKKKTKAAPDTAVEAVEAAEAVSAAAITELQTPDAAPEPIPGPPESSAPQPAVEPPAMTAETSSLQQATTLKEQREAPVGDLADDDSDFLAGLWPEEPAPKAAPTARATEPASSREAAPPPPRQLAPRNERPAPPTKEPRPVEARPEPAIVEFDAEGLLTEPLTGPAAPEAAPSEGQNGEGQNGERRRRRRRGRRGRGKGRDQEGGELPAQQNGAPRRQQDQSDSRSQQAPSRPRDSQPGGREPQQGQRERRDERGSSDRQDRRDQQNRRESRERHGQGERRPTAQPHPAPAPAQAAEEAPDLKQADGQRVMLINIAEGDECRIAILHQGRLEELFMERASAGSHVGNIYKGRVTNVEPSIQAAFIDFGMPKNGFLHISDLQPQYFPDGMRQVEEVGRKTPRRERPPIQKCLRRGQEVLVQIIKEGIGTKGPTLTTYISIPGRFLVMLPGMNRLGVSRKIEDEELRRKMRRILDELELPKDMGFILRTAGTDCAKRELQRDLQYLQRLWKVVANRIKNERAPCELYQESDLVIRTVRDVFSADFGKIIVDDEATAEKIRDFISIVMPRGGSLVEVYKGPEPLFHKYGIEQEIERINARHVPLSSGGSLVIDSTEALVAIDVNSGRFRDLEDAEETAYRINLEAAEEIARQLRLRDLGGLIVCDFIDMRMDKHRRAVERALRDALKKHKERAKCLRMSQFGIIEITRQRMRPSIKRSIYQDCPHCRGSGLVKNAESMTLDIMRLLRLTAHKEQVQTVEVRVAPTVAHQLLNRKRAVIYALEQESGRRIIIRADSNLGMDQYLFECMDARGGIVETLEPPVDAKNPNDGRSRRNNHSSDSGRDIREARETYEDVFD